MRASVATICASVLVVVPAYGQIEDPPELIDVWSTGTYPSGIAVDDDGTIYACHFYNGNIMVFAPDGTLLRTLGSSGSGDGQFINPEGIALDAAGNIYVTDFGLGRVQKFSNGGTWISTWGFSYTESQGIAVDPQDWVYAADRYHVRKFDSSGNLVRSWGGQGTGLGQFNSAQGIAIDSHGFVYVADRVNRTIQKFTADGAYVRSYGQPSQFTEPQGVALDRQDAIYVCDFPAYRVTKFAQDGTQLSNWSSTRPIFIAADRFDNLYVTSSVGASITKYSYPGPIINVQSGSWTNVKAIYREDNE